MCCCSHQRDLPAAHGARRPTLARVRSSQVAPADARSAAEGRGLAGRRRGAIARESRARLLRLLPPSADRCERREASAGSTPYSEGAQPGGVPTVLAELAAPELRKANRAAIHEGEGLVVLPLEQETGRLALIDVRDASAPRLAGPVVTLPRGETEPSTTYCAAFDASGSYLYAFAAQANTMYVYAVHRSR